MAIFVFFRLTDIGKALCRHENFQGLISITLISPFSRTQIDPTYTLPTKEQKEFDDCQMIYLNCIPNTQF